MSKKSKVLIVDDEASARTALAELLGDEGYEVETAADAFKALGKVEWFSPHLLLTDLKMPGMDGIELMGKAREADPSCAVVIMTAFGAVETAVSAMRSGAADYVTKPINFDALLVVLERTLEHRRLREETDRLRERLTERFDFDNFVGASPEIQNVFNVVSQVAPARASVLITGESGTGKELVASALHQRSKRRDGPFVKLHCAALAESLLESELFGHEKGAFTGAVARREGRFEQADGGTLFLDEIGDISPGVQVKLLRFLQEQEFERVGGSRTLRVDVRVIAATNRDLERAVREGQFREDLYYRLNVVSIDVPALRQRPSDIPLLAAHFLDRYAAENEKELTGFSDEAIEAMVGYGWPGNVRELENAVERAVVLSPGPQVERDALPAAVAPARAAVASGPRIPGSSLAEIEKHAILETLEATGGSTSRAAEILGISVRKIQYKLHQYRRAPKSHGEAVAAAGASGGGGYSTRGVP